MNEYYGFPSEKITCPSYYYPVRDVNFIKLKGAGCAEISVLGVGGLLTKIFDLIYSNQYVVPYALGGNIQEMCDASFA